MQKTFTQDKGTGPCLVYFRSLSLGRGNILDNALSYG
jgi:hypothetical protein